MFFVHREEASLVTAGTMPVVRDGFGFGGVSHHRGVSSGAGSWRVARVVFVEFLVVPCERGGLETNKHGMLCRKKRTLLPDGLRRGVSRSSPSGEMAGRGGEERCWSGASE